MFDWLVGPPTPAAPVMRTDEEAAELEKRQTRLEEDMERLTDARRAALQAEARVLGRKNQSRS